MIELKTAWLNKKLPNVTKGIFGDKLTPDNISLKKVCGDSFVLVGDKKSGILNDKEVVDYFLQFTSYPQYRRYILNTLRKLDNVRAI